MVKKKKKKKTKKKVKKTKSKKKLVRKKSRGKQARGKAAKKQKTIAIVDHFFGHISVAAFKLKAPLRVGDKIWIKGHTTDFVQKVESIQSNHKDILKAGKGTEVGIKVKGKVRTGDTIYVAPLQTQTTAGIKPIGFQQPMFPKRVEARPQLPKPQAKPTPPQVKKKPRESGPYSGKKFLSF